jgi:hypothetical protein
MFEFQLPGYFGGGLFSPMTKECGDLLFPRDGAVNLQH